MDETLDYRDPEWVAERLNIDKNAVYRYLNEGVLPGLQLGRKWLISESSLVQFLKAEEGRQTEYRRRTEAAASPGSRRFEKFTERAKKILNIAQEEAITLNHNYIGQEHFLLGIAAVPEGLAAVVLANLGVAPERLRAAVNQIVAPGAGPKYEGEIGLTARAKNALSLAVEEARSLNHAYVGGEHLLLGLLREPEGMGHEVLARLGITLEAARTEITRLLAKGPPPPEGWQSALNSRNEESETGP
jgi:excisionase family DNA binding protein